METVTGVWLDAVDYSVDFPDEPLVQVGIPKESPFRRAIHIDGIDQLTPFYGDKQFGRYVCGGNEDGNYSGGAGDVVRALIAAERVLLEHGPTEAARITREALGEPKTQSQLFSPLFFRNHVPRKWNSAECSEAYLSSHGGVPNMIGLTPVAAGLYLAAIGLSDKPVPLSFARALLDPCFKFPDNLAELTSIKAASETVLHTLFVDERHRLVIHPDRRRFAELGLPTTSCESEPLHVLSDGWRWRVLPIFLGHPVTPTDRTVPAGEPWVYDHDGERLVRLQSSPRTEVPKSSIPIVELEEIVPDMMSLFNDVRDNPLKMLDGAQRRCEWDENRSGVSASARRIVESALREFTPWPNPFKPRPESELRLRPRESTDAVVALFDRLLEAPGPMRPTDLTAYFISLITKRRAEFAAWPEECAGVWGFKIKTGDHNWINGRIWHEPGETDNLSDPVEFEAEDIKIETGRFRNRYRHRVHLWTGSLCCYIQCDDT